MNGMWDKTIRMRNNILHILSAGYPCSSDTICDLVGLRDGEDEPVVSSAKYRGRIVRACASLEKEGKLKKSQSYNGHTRENYWALTEWFKNIVNLKKLESKQNDGRGVASVREVIFWIENKNLHSAKVVFDTDHDKIHNYPDIEKEFIRLFGWECGYKK